MNPMLRLAVIAALVLVIAGEGAAEIDPVWAERAEGATEGRPDGARLEEALLAYERAVVAERADVEARWKLLRMIYFAGSFGGASEAEKRELFEQARRVSVEGLRLLADRLGGDSVLEEIAIGDFAARLAVAGVDAPAVARLYFWSAICWASWSQHAGMMTAVVQGAAGRMKRYAEISIALEPDYEGGGALRLLGTLHARLPRVPLVSGWVDRGRALPLVERAYQLDPGDPGNRLLLAMTLLDLEPARSAEAAALLAQVAESEPRPGMRLEDLQIRETARELLEERRAGDARKL